MALKLEVQVEGNKIYSPLRDKWLVLTPEEQVRQSYICRLVNVYGYDLEQMDEEINVSVNQRGNGKARADIVVWKSKEGKKNNDSVFIVVECKAEKVKIKQCDYYQGASYAAMSGASFFVTTNEKETKFFRVYKNKMPKKLDEINDIPDASIINNEKEQNSNPIINVSCLDSQTNEIKLKNKRNNTTNNNDNDNKQNIKFKKRHKKKLRRIIMNLMLIKIIII